MHPVLHWGVAGQGSGSCTALQPDGICTSQAACCDAVQGLLFGQQQQCPGPLRQADILTRRATPLQTALSPAIHPAIRNPLCPRADLPTVLTRVSTAWLVSQPVAAAQLVLVTAAEGKSLVPAFGDFSFAAHMPLAASGKCGQAGQHAL